jgi:hypothetical protein
MRRGCPSRALALRRTGSAWGEGGRRPMPAHIGRPFRLPVKSGDKNKRQDTHHNRPAACHLRERGHESAVEKKRALIRHTHRPSADCKTAMHLCTTSISLAGSATPPARFAPHIFNKRTMPAVNAGSCGGKSQPNILGCYGRQRGWCVPGNVKKDIVGNGGVVDPPRVRMSVPRWYKLRVMGTKGATASWARV